jgi:DNA polymerase III subunit epsilon
MSKDKLYAIIDIETTGGRADRDKITEIAILLHDGQRVLDTYQTLINPERSIPENITQITHITNEMVASAPRFYEVAKDIVKMTEGAIFVAHNVRFDYSFIQQEFKRLGYTYSRRQLCTVRLTRKVFPEIRRYGLSNLIQHFNLTIGNNRHRAMGDAAATAELFEIIMNESSHNQADAMLMVNLGIKESQLPANITLTKLHELPEETGVYYFYNKEGEIIYVGKSINIKKRVMSHFAEKTEKSRNLYERVWDIQYEVTGSELVALLLESHEIKKYHPIINRAQRSRSYPYAVYIYENQEGYLCMNFAKLNKKQKDALKVIQEYATGLSAKSGMAKLMEQHSLCQTFCNIDNLKRPCFYHQIHKCSGACIGKESPADYNARVRNAIANMDTDFEEDFILLDQGRSETEKSVILIEDGIYKGFGFADEDVPHNSVDDLKDLIEPYMHNPDTYRIIRGYMMAKRSDLKKIRL